METDMRKTSQDRYRKSMGLPPLQEAIEQSLEETVKDWMRVGLQDDKWIQLAPGSTPFHPWFDDLGRVIPENMASDAYGFDGVQTEDILRWAQEVADEYEHPLIWWEVTDHHSGLPIERIQARTNTEALDLYVAKYHVDTSKFHMIEAKLAPDQEQSDAK